MLALTGSTAGVGITISSWALVAIAVIALGGTLIAMGRRYKHRHGAKP